MVSSFKVFDSGKKHVKCGHEDTQCPVMHGLGNMAHVPTMFWNGVQSTWLLIGLIYYLLGLIKATNLLKTQVGLLTY